ncbi:MAG: GC-type dockerin domain-anchored protein [Planctomycetota bacterium]
MKRGAMVVCGLAAGVSAQSVVDAVRVFKRGDTVPLTSPDDGVYQSTISASMNPAGDYLAYLRVCPGAFSVRDEFIYTFVDGEVTRLVREQESPVPNSTFIEKIYNAWIDKNGDALVMVEFALEQQVTTLIYRDGELLSALRQGDPVPEFGGLPFGGSYPDRSTLPFSVSHFVSRFELDGTDGDVNNANKYFVGEVIDGQMRGLARSNTRAPGIEPVRFAQQAFTSSSLSPEGVVYLSASLHTSGANASPLDRDQVIYRYDDGVPTLLLREGDLYPGDSGIVFEGPAEVIGLSGGAYLVCNKTAPNATLALVEGHETTFLIHASVDTSGLVGGRITDLVEVFPTEDGRVIALEAYVSGFDRSSIVFNDGVPRRLFSEGEPAPGLDGFTIDEVVVRAPNAHGDFLVGAKIGRSNYSWWVWDASMSRLAPVLATQVDAAPPGVGGFGAPLDELFAYPQLSDQSTLVFSDGPFTETGQRDLYIAQVELPCSSADVALPLGFIDLADVDAFIAAFLAEEPLADVAIPLGLIDLADIDAFIVAFVAGCS